MLVVSDSLSDGSAVCVRDLLSEALPQHAVSVRTARARWPSHPDLIGPQFSPWTSRRSGDEVHTWRVLRPLASKQTMRSCQIVLHSARERESHDQALEGCSQYTCVLVCSKGNACARSCQYHAQSAHRSGEPAGAAVFVVFIAGVIEALHAYVLPELRHAVAACAPAWPHPGIWQSSYSETCATSHLQRSGSRIRMDERPCAHASAQRFPTPAACSALATRE